MLVWLGRFAGLRVGESLGVNIADFIDGGTVLRLQRQRDTYGKLGPLKARKSGEFRDVPVPPELWEKVKDAPRDAEGYLFRAECRTSTMKAWRNARKAAGLPAAFVPHTLRHLYASVLLSNGVAITDLAEFIGHRNIQITYAIYGHLVPSALSRASAVLSAEWEEKPTLAVAA